MTKEQQEKDITPRKGIAGMFSRAFERESIQQMTSDIVEKGINSEPVQRGGAEIIRQQTDLFVRETLPDELRKGYGEAEDLGPTYTMIRESIKMPEDSFFKRIFKSMFAAALTGGVKISALIGGTILADRTGESEEEKRRYPLYIERIIAMLFRRNTLANA